MCKTRGNIFVSAVAKYETVQYNVYVMYYKFWGEI
jgi:hypothetical protein